MPTELINTSTKNNLHHWTLLKKLDNAAFFFSFLLTSIATEIQQKLKLKI